jgi:hypothetical protein
MAWMPYVVAPVVGAVAGSLLAPHAGGSAPGVNPVANLPGQEKMGRDLQSATQNYMKTAEQYYGMDPNYANQAFMQMYNNPYAQNVQAGANQAGGIYGSMVPGAMRASQQAMGAGQQALGASQQIYNTAFDPQQDLYRQQQQRTLDQANMTNSMYGLGASPVGAGAANQALSNFNIDWQNQQLGRQIQGQQALGQGINQYTGATNAGLGYGQAGAGFAQQAGAMPYMAAQGISQDQMAAIMANQAAMQGGMGQYQQNIGNMQRYLGIGADQQSQANQQAYQQQLLAGQGAGNIANLATSSMYAYLNRPQQYPTQQQSMLNSQWPG